MDILDQVHEESATSLEHDIAKMSELYPSFDFEAECTNPDFKKLIEAGISMQKAYECMHLSDLLAPTPNLESVPRNEGECALGPVGAALWQSERSEREKIEKLSLSGHKVRL